MKLSTLLLASALLVSCASNETSTSDSMTLYSPPFLHFRKGQEVQTAKGVYKVQVDEVWHSDAEYQARVAEGLRR